MRMIVFSSWLMSWHVCDCHKTYSTLIIMEWQQIIIGCFINVKNDEKTSRISNIHWKEKCLKHHSKMTKSEMLSRLIDALVTTMDLSDEWSVWLMTTWRSIWGVTWLVIIHDFHFCCHITISDKHSSWWWYSWQKIKHYSYFSRWK